MTLVLEYSVLKPFRADSGGDVKRCTRFEERYTRRGLALSPARYRSLAALDSPPTLAIPRLSRGALEPMSCSSAKGGPNKTKYKDGTATTIVSYFPQVDVDGTAYLDDEGDESGDLVDNRDDEEEEEGGGEARRRDGNDSDGGVEEGNSHSIDEMEEGQDYEE
ncbi:hypothetical protein JCM5350_007610 [Sporobolomyces pararoseus]